MNEETEKEENIRLGYHQVLTRQLPRCDHDLGRPCGRRHPRVCRTMPLLYGS
jgi:hypothetical protein